MSTPSYPIRAPKINRLKAPKPLRGLDGIATPKIDKRRLPDHVVARAEAILQAVSSALGGRKASAKPELAAPYGGYPSPSHQQWGVQHPEDRARAEAVAQVVHKSRGLGWSTTATPQPKGEARKAYDAFNALFRDIDLHDLQPSFTDSIPAAFTTDTLDHLPSRKMETGTIHAEPPPARNQFGMPVRIFEGDIVRSTRTGGYAQVTRCHPDGTFDVQTLPERQDQCWAASICEAVPAHTAVPVGKNHAGIEPDRPWPRKRINGFAVGEWVMVIAGPDKGTLAQIERIHPNVGDSIMLEVCDTDGKHDVFSAHMVCHHSAPAPKPAKAPRPRFLQRRQPEPFDFESFFGPLCIVAFMVGIIGAIIANKLVMGAGLVATIVFGVLGLRK